jgi:hypothetical protein
MSAHGAQARAIDVLARCRAIRAQHGARHCIAHQGERMQGENCERLRTRMGSNFRSPSSSNSVRNFFSLAAHSPQNHCAAHPPRPSRPLRPAKSADGPVSGGSGAGAASTRGSADGRARARHEGHTVHPSPAAIAARGLWARAQRRGRLQTEQRTGCPSRRGSAKPSVRRSQQAPVRHNRQVGRQTRTHSCPRRTPRHNFVCSPWLPCALPTSRRITPCPSSPPVARRGKAGESPSRAASRAVAVRTQSSALGRARTRHEGLCVPVASSAIAARASGKSAEHGQFPHCA